jgi:PEP-CTERM motif
MRNGIVASNEPVSPNFPPRLSVQFWEILMTHRHSSRALVVVLTTALLSIGTRTSAAPIDLAHPTLAATSFTGVCGQFNCDRSVVFDVLTTFSITSADIAFDPLAGGPTGVFVDIYQSSLNATFSNLGASHGALLATASASIVDAGLTFYDVPIAFTFLAGQRYDVAFRGNLATSWGGPQTSMPFYAFNRASPGGAYIDGPVRVVDGACHPIDVCSGYGNFLMPHVRLETVEATAVPEPATLTLLAAGLAIAGRRARRRTSPKEKTAEIAKTAE